MQQSKITDNLGEFQKFLENDDKTGLCLEDTMINKNATDQIRIEQTNQRNKEVEI